MNRTTKTNIINFLNHEDKHANIDNTYSSHELLALFIYTLNYNVLDCYNWFDLMEYSQEELLEDMDSKTREAYNLLDGSSCDEKVFQKIIEEYVK